MLPCVVAPVTFGPTGWSGLAARLCFRPGSCYGRGEQAGTSAKGNGWSVADIPDLTGRAAVVTGCQPGHRPGGRAGPACKGAQVALAVRRTERGEAAAAAIAATSRARYGGGGARSGGSGQRAPVRRCRPVPLAGGGSSDQTSAIHTKVESALIIQLSCGNTLKSPLGARTF